MKHVYILLILSILDWKPVLSQDDTQNYIRTRVMLDENASKYLETFNTTTGWGVRT